MAFMCGCEYVYVCTCLCLLVDVFMAIKPLTLTWLFGHPLLDTTYPFFFYLLLQLCAWLSAHARTYTYVHAADSCVETVSETGSPHQRPGVLLGTYSVIQSTPTSTIFLTVVSIINININAMTRANANPRKGVGNDARRYWCWTEISASTKLASLFFYYYYYDHYIYIYIYIQLCGYVCLCPLFHTLDA